MNTMNCFNRELLLSFKRLCSERNYFRGAKPDDAVFEYYKTTMGMVDEALAEKQTIDEELVFTIISNLLTVLNAAATSLSNVPAKNRKKTIITFNSMDFDSAAACRFLDEGTQISRRYNRLIKREKQSERIQARRQAPRYRKTVRILKRIFLILLILGALFAFSGIFIPNSSSQPVSGNLWVKAKNWYLYDLRKEALPVSFAEKWVATSWIVGKITAAIAGLSLMGFIVHRVFQQISKKKASAIRQEWNDYQHLCEAFSSAATELNGLEW